MKGTEKTFTTINNVNFLENTLYDLEQEKYLLAGFLLDEKLFDRYGGLFTEEDFYSDIHQKIFIAIRELFLNGKKLSFYTVYSFLREKFYTSDDEQLRSYLSSFMDVIIHTGDFHGSVHYLKELSIRRKLLRLGETIFKNTSNANLLIEDIFRNLENNFIELYREKEILEQGNSDVLVGAIGQKVIEELKYLSAKNNERQDRIFTGFSHLDEILTGLYRGDFIVIAGRPGMGKTSFVLDMARRIALSGKKVVCFSLEMSKELLLKKILSAHAQIDYQKLRAGNLTKEEILKIEEILQECLLWQFIIDDTPLLDLTLLKTKLKNYQKKLDGLDLVVIDYLQLMQGRKENSREREIAEISAGLKRLAKEFQVPFVVTSQLNRKVEEREDKRPLLSDLRESGAIEQDADVVIFLYRDEFYNPDTDKKGIAEVIIAKQRNGPVGAIYFKFLKEFSSFFEIMEITDLEDISLVKKKEKPKNASLYEKPEI